MSVRLLTIATLLSIVLPLLVGASVFFVALPWWIDRQLRFDRDVHERLRLDGSEDSIAFTIASDPPAWLRLPYPALVFAALAALAVTAVETAAFASSSGVPDLWYAAGIVVAATALLAPFACAWLLRGPLRRHLERALHEHANDKLLFAAQAIHQIGEVGRQIDEAYASMGLRARVNVVTEGQQALLEHAWVGRDAALTEVIRIRMKADHDLRNLQYLARLAADVRIALNRATIAFRDVDTAQEALAQIDERIRSRRLADALQEGRWPDALDLLEKIRFDLGRMLDDDTRDNVMPETVADALRFLNVSEGTPLDVIKTVITAYRRVWHPDLAQDDIERQRRTLRMQQINVAWDLVQRARAPQ
jgi:hypothetical protein